MADEEKEQDGRRWVFVPGNTVIRLDDAAGLTVTTNSSGAWREVQVGDPGRPSGSGHVRDKDDFDGRIRTFLANWQGDRPPKTEDAAAEIKWKERYFRRRLHDFGWKDWPTARGELSGGRYPK